jgi:hypothetical protein
MKKRFIFIIISFLFAFQAFAEQKIVNEYTQYYYRPLSQEGSCQYYCTEKMSQGINIYLQNGWRVISVRPIDTFISPFHAGNDSYCKCVGSEYIIEK